MVKKVRESWGSLATFVTTFLSSYPLLSYYWQYLHLLFAALTPFSVACDSPFLLPFGLRRHLVTSHLSAVIRHLLLPLHILLHYQRLLSLFSYHQLDSIHLLMSSPKPSMLWLSSSSEIISPSSAGSIQSPKLDLHQFLLSSLTQLVHICVVTIRTPPFTTMVNPAVLVLSSLHLPDL